MVITNTELFCVVLYRIVLCSEMLLDFVTVVDEATCPRRLFSCKRSTVLYNNQIGS